MNGSVLHSYESREELVWAVAQAWVGALSQAASPAPSYHVALSGGRVAQPFYAQLAGHCAERPGLLAHVDFWWADERCVPPEDERSNFFVAHRNLLKPLRIDPARIHRIKGEMIPEAAAEEAARQMRAAVPLNSRGLPVLDLVWLGMGEDGHVASLFPEERPVDGPSPTVYRVVHATKPPPQRITLSYPVLWAAKEVWVMISGSGKEKALARSLAAGGGTPLARVLAGRTRTVLFSDSKPAKA